MEFLGSCRVCGKVLHNYRSLAGHLRHNQDSAHLQLRVDWESWKGQYQATLRCRKCGGLWKIYSKAERSSKRCPPCEQKFKLLGKKAYETWRPEVLADPRVKVRTTKARWVGLSDLHFKWSRGDTVYEAVRDLLSANIPVRTILSDLGITHKVFQNIAKDILGEVGYQEWYCTKKTSVGKANLDIAHRNYRSLTPEEKAARLKRMYGDTCKLEAEFAKSISYLGLPLVMNDWQAVPIHEYAAPREADIKI